MDVSLSPAVEVDEGIHGAGTYLIGTPVWNDQQLQHDNGGLGAETAVRIGLLLTPVDTAGAPTGAEPEFFVYEPNANAHIDGSYGFVDTPSLTGGETLVDRDHLITQTFSTWEESDPVEHGVVVKDLGEFTSDTKLFSLRAGEVMRIDVYIWLEGQDVDCTNQIRDALLHANLQFDADATGQSGLVPIDPEE